MIANPNNTLLECKKFKLLIFPSFFLILNLCDLYIVIQIHVPLNIDIHLSILSQGPTLLHCDLPSVSAFKLNHTHRGDYSVSRTPDLH